MTFDRLESSNLCLLSSQDLSNEQRHSQALSAEVQRLKENLQKAEAELVITSEALSQSQERTDSLSKLLDQSHLRLENINGGVEEAVSSAAPVCQSRSRESRVDQTPEADEGDEGETEQQLRERLTALEREVRE